MARRKKHWWKPNIKTDSLLSVIALFLILFSLILIISLLGSWIGADNILEQAVSYLFGYGSYILPFLLLVTGLNLTKLKFTLAQPRALWGTIILFIGILLTITSIFNNGGGAIGKTLADYLSDYITVLGTFVTGLTITAVAFLILLNLSIHDAISYFSKFEPYFSQIKTAFSKNKDAQANNMDGSTKQEHASDNKSQTSSPPNPINIKSNRQIEQNNTIEILDDNKIESISAEPKSTATQGSTKVTTADMTPEDETLPYVAPPITLLEEAQQTVTDQGLIEKNARIIEATLGNFGIQARIAEVNLGPAVTQYAINLAEGTRSSKILSLQNDIALALASPTGNVRIESPIPGKHLIGIEVPNNSLSVVRLKSILNSKVMKNDPSPLAVALGEDVSGQPVISHIDKWPHILIAGSTGSGKSVLIHSIIMSVLFRATPAEVKFILIDPKRVELTQYNNTPHLQSPVIVDVDRTINAFKWAVEEMEKRYRLFQQIGARNLVDFNQHTDTDKLPYIVIVVDELADLMVFAANDMEVLITRIAQKARATGILMILSTQRPSVDVITGLIKANIPTRIALNVSSSTDSRVILDQIGADKLLGKGDMLYLPPDAGKPKRVQGVFLSNQEINRVTDYLKQFKPGYLNPSEPSKEQSSPPILQPSATHDAELSSNQSDDNKFIDAVKVILNHDKASASLLQRRLKIGYARAARMLDELQEKGLVGPPDGSNPREIHIDAALAYIQKLGLTTDESHPAS